MPRYIDADKLKRDLIDNRCFYPVIVKSAIENAPTEDVVPRSEVEELKKIYRTYNKAIKYERQEVAKQIFEEIEKIISKNTQYDIKYGQLMVSGYNGRQIARFIDDLKKKYIGE